MPNALAHFGVQGALTRGLWRDGDARWIYLGCVLPDVAWILLRFTRTALVSSVDIHDLRLYAIVQASLAFSLLLAAACAALCSQPRRVFLFLALNCTAHLLLDACQIKWGNGVHLLAPFSWELTNFGFFWPDSWPTYALTLAGLAVIVWEVRRPRGRQVPLRVPARRLAVAVVFLALYLVAPVLFLDPAEASDSHSVRTLRRTAHRIGKEAAFDRNDFVHADNGNFLRVWNGEVLRLRDVDLVSDLASNLGVELDHDADVSLKGVFITESELRVTALHEHRGPSRDWPTYVGFFLLLVLWVRSFALRK